MKRLSSRAALISAFVLCLMGGSALVNAQHGAAAGVDPAYLRQYYQQLQHQQQGGADATPIYEQNSEQSQQYVSPGQQLRLKDTVQEQVRAQQQAGYVAPAVRDYLQQQQQQHQAQPQQTQQQYQAQPQQVVYRQPQVLSAPRRAQPSPLHQYQSAKDKAQQEEEEYDDQNSSYQFGFDVKDDEFTNYQNRKEVRDGSVIKGSYSVVDSDGFIRTVKYTADPKEGFKAEVIREPTDIVVKVPTPAPQQQLLRAHGGGGGHHKSQDYSLKQQYQHQQQQQQQQQQYHQYQQ